MVCRLTGWARHPAQGARHDRRFRADPPDWRGGDATCHRGEVRAGIGASPGARAGNVSVSAAARSLPLSVRGEGARGERGIARRKSRRRFGVGRYRVIAAQRRRRRRRGDRGIAGRKS